jgi:hypothetical protein
MLCTRAAWQISMRTVQYSASCRLLSACRWVNTSCTAVHRARSAHDLPCCKLSTHTKLVRQVAVAGPHAFNADGQAQLSGVFGF